jgi:hypothetical protein
VPTWATPASSSPTFTHRISTGQTINSIAYNGSNLYVAAGNSGALYTSADGATWTSRTSGFGSNNINKVFFGNSLWVAVGANGTITTSSDGTTWTARTANMSTNAINDVIFANSTWVAVGAGGGATNTGGITYSTDGITWTRKSQTPTIGTGYNAIAWNGTNYVIAADISTNNYLYASTASGTWTAGADGTGSNLINVYWDGTRNILIDASGGVWYSTSTTVGTTTSISGLIMRTASRSNYYYNGNLYSNGITISIYSSTPTASNYYTKSIMPFLSPIAKNTSAGGITGSGNATLFVGSAGYIITSGDNGEIFTSF